jgi:hypothetical protein
MRHFVEEGGFPKLNCAATEIQLSAPLGGHTLIGTPDAILDNNPDPGFDSGQWKTCQGGQDIERQCDAVRWSYHEAAYRYLMNHNGYPCRGTTLGIYKKLTKAELVAGANPFYLIQLPAVPKEWDQEVLSELEIWADRMGMVSDGAAPLLPHRRSCIIGNIRCQYWSTCYEGLPLSDGRYINSDQRYDLTQIDHSPKGPQ